MQNTKPNIQSQQELFANNLPKKPYCSNDLTYGVRIRDAETALSHRYIQPNQPNSKLWLLFDIDRPTCPYQITDDLNLPAPTIFVQNPENHHAHLYYALETSVHLNQNSSLKAIRFAGAVDVSLSGALDADAGYSGLIAKNPFNEHWRSYYIGGQYELSEIAEYLDLSRYSDRRRHLPEVGLGRNCTLFDRTRKWAYKAIREDFDISFNSFMDEVLTQALCYNTAFDSQLHFSEVKAISKSIAKYVKNNFRASKFSEIQSERGKRSGKARLAMSEDKRTQAIEMYINGKSVRDIASVLNVGKSTVHRWIK